MPEIEEPSLSETLENILGLLTRRAWWIVVPTFFVTLAAVAYALRLPDRYESEATLVFVPQQVSQRYVEPTTNTTPTDVIQSIKQEVLSRNKLLAIIDEFRLYAKDRQNLAPDTLAERMRDDDVAVTPLDEAPGKEARAFTITFSADHAQLAQAVTSRLASLFIEENLKTRGQLAASTSNFVTEQVEAAQKRLAEQDQRLRDFTTRNMSVLPEQQQANLGALQDLQLKLQSTTLRLSQAQQQRNFLQTTISGNLATLKSERSKLMEGFKEKHPAVIKKDQEIARMQNLLDRLDKPVEETDRLQTATLPDDPAVIQLRNQVDSIASELSSLPKDEASLTTQIAQVQARLNLTPIVSQQLAAIQRDYNLYKEDYTAAVKNQMQAQVTSNLEQSEEAQRFQVTDPASLPSKPSDPKRLKISAGGAAAGLALGLALAFLMDVRNQSVHNEQELKRRFAVPVVVGVPLLFTSAEKRARGLRKAIGWTAGSAMTLAVLAAEFYVYRRG